MDDLEEIFPSIYESLDSLLNYQDDDLEDVFLLDFTINEVVFGKNKIVDLIPNGSNILVNQSNKALYIDKVVDYYLNSSIDEMFCKFLSGFFKVCSKESIVF